MCSLRAIAPLLFYVHRYYRSIDDDLHTIRCTTRSSKRGERCVCPSKPEVKLSGPAEYYNMCQKCVI